MGRKVCKKCGTDENVNFNEMCQKCYENSIKIVKKSEEDIEKEEQTERKTLIQKWWFWLIIAIVFVVIANINNNSNIKTSSNTINNSTTNSTSKKTQKENPYKITNDYDGVYKFILNSDNGSGHVFTSKGAISFKNGICKAKYVVNSDTLSEYSREYEGFCGINEKDNSIFYFSLKDDEILYRCSNTNGNLSCKLKSRYDLSGCYNEELILTYIEDSQDINKVLSQVIEEEKLKKEAEEKAKKEQEEKDFKSSCNTYTYEQIARNPEKFKGTNVKLTGEVIQVITGSYSTNLRVNITKTGTYSTYYTDTIYVVYYPESGEDKILEDDIITIYGTSQGDCSYTSVLGATITLPNINAKYITIEE